MGKDEFLSSNYKPNENTKTELETLHNSGESLSEIKIKFADMKNVKLVNKAGYKSTNKQLKKWGLKKGFNPELLESYTNNYTGREGTNDFVCVILKDKKFTENYENRILDKHKTFRNGKTNKSDSIINLKKLTQDQDNWGWRLFFK